ncbi:tetratricopeptide repeat protein [Oleiharenicola lentus]|uniref:tetratricopeptide repeat protein n=1 Tax=Oleiharenicola lentus TaxID=2508720 RepID=UPI003F66AA4D
MKRSSRPAPLFETSSSALEFNRWKFAGLFAAIFAVTFIAYLPALKGELLWDDIGHVTSPALQSWSGLLRIWFEPGATQQYYPLLHSAFWLEHKLWGDATAGYHVINVIWHALSACLLITVLRRLAIPGAIFAGLLFALHPVCVESVAWITEQKNTLSLVLYLSAALAYLCFDRERSPRSYALALVFFAGALLSKTVTASLPAALLVIFWWQRGRLAWRRDIVPLLPWFALGVASGLFTAHFERALIGAQGSEFALNFADRLVLAGRVFWFYLGKLIWPAELIFVYPRWIVDASIWWQWLFTFAGLGLLASLIWWSRRNRGPLAAALLFGGSLFPALGFFNVYPFLFSYVADHFQYLASLAIFATAGVALTFLPRKAGIITGALLTTALGIVTWHHAASYRDNVTLYETTLQRNPDAWLAHHNLAVILVDRGQSAAALPHLERTLALRPNYPEALNTFGNALTQLGRASEAIAPLDRAIQLQPHYAEAHNTLGVAFMALGRAEAGLTQFETAVHLKPDYATAHRNFGQALLNAKRLPEATQHFTRAVQLDAADLSSLLQLGTVLALQGRYADALPHLQAVLEINPESDQAHLRLALALRSLGRTTEANAHYQQALQFNPTLGR